MPWLKPGLGPPGFQRPSGPLSQAPPQLYQTLCPCHLRPRCPAGPQDAAPTCVVGPDIPVHPVGVRAPYSRSRAAREVCCVGTTGHGCCRHTARMCPAGAVTVTADTRLPRVPYRVAGRGQGGAGRWRGGHRPACGRLPGSSSSTNGQRDLWEARDSPAPRHRPRPAGLCPLHVSGGLCPQTLSPTLSPTATASPVIVPRPFIVPGPRPPSSACVLLKDLERPSGQAAKDVSTELDQESFT